MRISEFWDLMGHEFGAGYARSVATDQTMSSLDGRTAAQALDDGVAPAKVWQAVCDAMQIPENRRWGPDTRSRK